MMADDTGQRGAARSATLQDLKDLMSSAQCGMFDQESVRRADHLRAWIAAAPGMEDVDLDDPVVFAGLLQTVDRYAQTHPTSAKTVGQGGNFTVTDAVRAVGWLIRVDDQRGQGRQLGKRREDAAAVLQIEIRQLQSDRWQNAHHMGDVYLDYLRRVLGDAQVRQEILGHTPSEVSLVVVQDGVSSWWKRQIVKVAMVVTAVVVAIGILVGIRMGVDQTEVPDSAIATEQARYDGKDPRGIDGSDSKCADPPPSYSANGNQPFVVGPAGDVVGQIQLRTSSICPHVVWARVLWEGQETGLYTIPTGWTLHTVLRRPDTDTAAESLDAATGGEIQYGLSQMLTTIGGHCVLAEVYFSSDTAQTASTHTACIVVGG